MEVAYTGEITLDQAKWTVKDIRCILSIFNGENAYLSFGELAFIIKFSDLLCLANKCQARYVFQNL